MTRNNFTGALQYPYDITAELQRDSTRTEYHLGSLKYCDLTLEVQKRFSEYTNINRMTHMPRMFQYWLSSLGTINNIKESYATGSVLILDTGVVFYHLPNCYTPIKNIQLSTYTCRDVIFKRLPTKANSIYFYKACRYTQFRIRK